MFHNTCTTDPERTTKSTTKTMSVFIFKKIPYIKFDCLLKLALTPAQRIIRSVCPGVKSAYLSFVFLN